MNQKVPCEEAFRLCKNALEQNDISAESADAIAKSLIDAELQGKSNVGWPHLVDYLEAVQEGRVDGQASPKINRSAPALFQIDADGGFPHTGVEQVFDEFVEITKNYGISALGVNNGYISGELGYFVRSLANQDLLGLAATNAGPALLAASGSKSPVFCTNPLAFAVPRKQAPPLVIDQSCSATAFVNIREAAKSGESIPEGWALDSGGKPTTDPHAALKGVLLAFGGNRGANIAMMVELLAAGTTGANWSRDAPPFHFGNECTRTGLFIIALDANTMLGEDFSERVNDYLNTIQAEHQTYIPGEQRGLDAERRKREGLLIPDDVWKLLNKYDAKSV